jgi:dihydropteroate synthase
LRYFQKDGQSVTSPRNSIWRLAHGRSIALGPSSHIMAIVNVTPDSFSDGGRYADVGHAVAHGIACVRDGAAILDIGGESTRPGADAVSAAEEQDRVLPVIERLARETDALISIDTYRAETASLAVAAGAHIVNDVYGLRYDPDMANVVSGTGAGLCIMHTGRGRDDRLPDIIEDELMFFGGSLDLAKAAGIADDMIVLDPGFGFAKERKVDVELMARCHELHDLGYPLLVGTSRKRFVGAIASREAASERDFATAATTAILRMAGASIFRVHNVAGNLDALRMADAVLEGHAGISPAGDS